MSFFRHEEIYCNDGFTDPARRAGERELRPSPPIVGMSFRLAIPWRVALQQSPPPLRQLAAILKQRQFAAQGSFGEWRPVA